jgi:hypothetical protein
MKIYLKRKMVIVKFKMMKVTLSRIGKLKTNKIK